MAKKRKRRRKVNFSDMRYPMRKQKSMAFDLVSTEQLETLYVEWDNFSLKFAARGLPGMEVDFCNDEFREWFDSDECYFHDKKSFLPFREWSEKNKKVLTSPAFQNYKLEQRVQEEILNEKFRNLDWLKYHYDISLGYMGRWLSILDRWPEDEVTYQLAEALLLEVAISEFVFLLETNFDPESQEYKDWLLKSEKRNVFSHMWHRGSHDWEWQALKSDKNCYWGSREGAEVIISNVRGRVSSENPDEDIQDLIATERTRFLSSDMDFERYRSSAISSCFSSDLIMSGWLGMGKRLLQEWDARGRGSGWDALAIKDRDIILTLVNRIRSVWK